MTWRGHGRRGDQREEGGLQEGHRVDGGGDGPLELVVGERRRKMVDACPSGERATVRTTRQMSWGTERGGRKSEGERRRGRGNRIESNQIKSNRVKSN